MKKVDEAKSRWVEEFPSVLWDYKTTIKGLIGEMHVSLVYGIEALLMIEAEVHLNTILQCTIQQNWVMSSS